MILLSLTKKYYVHVPILKKRRGYRSFKWLWLYVAWMSNERAREMLVKDLNPMVIMGGDR